MTREKFILDAACGGRCFWFDKHHPNAIYIDIRDETSPDPHRPNFSVRPDIIMDNRKMDFRDETFKLVVWDPPHLLKLGQSARLHKKYGGLHVDRWRSDLRKGFNECWRVLKPYGILIFKWNESSIPLKEVLKCFHKAPLFGHPTGSKSKTHWLCFMKTEEASE